MESSNNTGTSQFHLHSLSDNPELESILFGVFLSMYLVTIIGNLLIILATISDSHLHTPMYFFLSNLSFVDICFISTNIPKMLVNIHTKMNYISYIDCLTQAYFLNIFPGIDNFLLSVMAYDRFVAICHPLNYLIIMKPRLCGLLVLTSWIIMFWISLIHILLMIKLNFSIGTEIPHFLCEIAHLLKAANSDTFANDIFMYIVAALIVAFPINGIIFSYSRICCTLMRMSSIASKYKAFSTCGSHLCVVSLFYGSGYWVYLSSSVTHSSLTNKIAYIIYAVITPMLNPFIYSLRNKDVKRALRRLLS